MMTRTSRTTTPWRNEESSTPHLNLYTSCEPRRSRSRVRTCHWMPTRVRSNCHPVRDTRLAYRSTAELHSS